MLVQTLLCFLAIVASATAISISGLASLDANAFEAQGKLTFPRVPGINTPLFSPSRIMMNDEEDAENIDELSDDTENGENIEKAQFFFPKHHHYGRSFTNLANVIPVPNITALLEARNITSNSTVIVLPIFPLPSLHKHKFFHGPHLALYHARKHLAEVLNTTGDVTLGIQNALQQAFMSNDPSAAINMLIQTILLVYGSAIRKCPFIFTCSKLTDEAAALVQRVITAIMTATVL